ncbi:MAG: SirA family protein [Gammaproteobacteria bacterium]|nr:SirA family protein [Gammaproteobacteria bacterium]
MTEYDQELDLTGLNCPLPILRTKKAIALAEPGTVIRVIGTDPGSPKVLSVEEQEGSYVYLLRKP